MQGNRKELSRKQEAALAALCGGSLSLVDVAAKISVHPSTLWRWMKQPEFQSRYRDLRRANVERSISKMQGLMDEAIETLRRNLSSGNRPSEVRAAVSIIRQSIEGVDVYDYDERIAAIERRFNDAK
jgi:transposase-like protein